MADTNERVIIVVDRNFGSRLLETAKVGYTWIVETPAHRSVVEKVWEDSRERGPASNYLGATYFNDYAPYTPEELLLEMIGMIELHHPFMKRVDVFGAHWTSDLEEAFSEFGFGNVTQHAEGFSLTRSSDEGLDPAE
jgi:hypothetical protein